MDYRHIHSYQKKAECLMHRRRVSVKLMTEWYDFPLSNESFESQGLDLLLLRTLLNMVSRYCFNRPFWTAFRSTLTAHNVPSGLKHYHTFSSQNERKMKFVKCYQKYKDEKYQL